MSMAKALNLAEDSFLNQYGERPIMYTIDSTSVLHAPGLKPHADGTSSTIVLPDQEVEGLQFLKDDLWARIPVNPHALLVNIGDLMDMMSNGIFKSPIHRALINSEKERISVSGICSPGVVKEVGSVGELINDKRPRLDKTVKDCPQKYFQVLPAGKRPIEAG